MRWTTARLLAFVACLAPGFQGCDDSAARGAWSWVETQSEPGPLDPAHQRLGLECSDCHQPIQGVEADGCIACHALNGPLVQQQTTAFHAEATVCADCHVEHVVPSRLRAALDHELFARLAADWPSGEAAPPGDGSLNSLACATCHGNQDPHFDLFGSECIDCHETQTWDVAGFAHPTPRSRDCAQCHQAPPSHYMKHFKMLSAKVARQPHAELRECYACHLTTSWPDIRGVGFYKHH